MKQRLSKESQNPNELDSVVYMLFVLSSVLVYTFKKLVGKIFTIIKIYIISLKEFIFEMKK